MQNCQPRPAALKGKELCKPFAFYKDSASILDELVSRCEFCQAGHTWGMLLRGSVMDRPGTLRLAWYGNTTVAGARFDSWCAGRRPVQHKCC